MILCVGATSGLSCGRLVTAGYGRCCRDLPVRATIGNTCIGCVGCEGRDRDMVDNNL